LYASADGDAPALTFFLAASPAFFVVADKSAIDDIRLEQTWAPVIVFS